MTGAVLAPVLPDLIEQLQLSPEWAGSLVSVHFLTLALFSPLLGQWADRHGQVRILIPALLCYGVLGLAGAVLPNYWLLLVDRGLLGVAAGGVAAAGLGLLTHRYEGEARNQAIAYVAMVITLANVVYPLLAGALGFFHWRLAFALYGTSFLLAALASLLLTGASAPVHTEAIAAVEVDLLGMLRQRACLRILFSLTATSAIVYGTIIYLPIYLKTEFATDTLLNGTMLAVQAIGAALSSGFLAAFLTHRWGGLHVIALGLGAMSFLLLLFPNVGSLLILGLVSILFGVSFGLVTPGLYATLANATPRQLQSSVLATGIGTGFLGQFLAPFLLGPVLQQVGLNGVFFSLSGLACLVGLSLLIPLKSGMQSVRPPLVTVKEQSHR